MKKHSTIIIISAIVFIGLTPILFTRPAFLESLQFIETGQIGDTIGGITAPFIGICSILLLCYTLKAQLDFNKAQAKDNRLSHITHLQSEIINLDSRVSFVFFPAGTVDEKEVSAAGIDSLLYLLEKGDKIKLFQAKLLLGQLRTIVVLCNLYYSFLSKEDRDFVAFYDIYRDKISSFLKGVTSNRVSIISNIQDIQGDDFFESELQLVKDQAIQINALFQKNL